MNDDRLRRRNSRMHYNYWFIIIIKRKTAVTWTTWVWSVCIWVCSEPDISVHAHIQAYSLIDSYVIDSEVCISIVHMEIWMHTKNIHILCSMCMRTSVDCVCVCAALPFGAKERRHITHYISLLHQKERKKRAHIEEVFKVYIFANHIIQCTNRNALICHLE